MIAIFPLPASELGTNQFRCLLRPNKTKAKTHLNIYNLSKDINTRLSSINKYIFLAEEYFAGHMATATVRCFI